MSCDLSILKNYLQSLDDYNAEIKNMSHVDYWPKYISIQNQRPKLPENCKDKSYDKYTIDELRNIISNEDNEFLNNYKSSSSIQITTTDNNPIIELEKNIKTKTDEYNNLLAQKEDNMKKGKPSSTHLLTSLDNVTVEVNKLNAKLHQLKTQLNQANSYNGGKRKSKRRKSKKPTKKGKKNRKSNKKSMKKTIKK